MRLHLVEPQGALVRAGNLQQALLDARNHHGVFLPGAVDSGHAREFPDSSDDRRARRRVSQAQPAELVHFRHRRCFALFATPSGGVDTGWTFYPPYSSLYSHTHGCIMALGVFIAGFSSILTGLNFVVTIHKMRAPGMTWFRLPLFIWAMYATSLIFILGTPVIAITLFLLGLERILHVGIFDPALGGDPLLFQHLFWFYSHPAVYIMILPGMGVVSELIAAFSRKKIFGYSFVAFSSMAIAVISFVVWGHHMFVTGQSIYAGLVFSMLELPGRDSFRRQGLQLDGYAL